MNGPRAAALVRAWMAALVLTVSGGLVGLLALSPDPARPPPPGACRVLERDLASAQACLDGRAPDILTAELAGAHAPWVCQLYRRPLARPAELDDLRCAELRAAGLREEVRSFDNGFFIPLYSVLSLLAVGVLVAHTRLCSGSPRRRLQALALVLALATATLAATDRQENHALLAVLDRMDTWGLASWAAPATAEASAADASAADASGVDAAAQATRQASTWKWAASAAWAVLLGAALTSALRRGWPGARAGPPSVRWQVASWLPLGLGVLGAALLLAAVWQLLGGVASSFPGGALAQPAGWIAWGMRASIGALLVTAAMMALALWRGRLPPPD